MTNKEFEDKIEALELWMTAVYLRLMNPISAISGRMDDAWKNETRNFATTIFGEPEEKEDDIKSNLEIILRLNNIIFKHNDKIRTCAQMLINEIGSDGPEDLEETVKRAIKIIQEYREKENNETDCDPLYSCPGGNLWERKGDIFEDPEDYSNKQKRFNK